MNSGRIVNYFEVLELSIEELQSEDEATIVKRVNEAYVKLYNEALNEALDPGYRNRPCLDGRSREEWLEIVFQAYDTLKDPGERREHIADLELQEEGDPARGALSKQQAALGRQRQEEEAALDLPLEEQIFVVEMGREPSPDAVGDRGMTDLHHAAKLNLPVLTLSLLKQGVAVDAKDKDGGTPLR